MVVELGALILDEGVVDRGEEVVRSGGAVVLLGVQPAGCEAGMPREDDLALGRGPGWRREGYGRRQGGGQNQNDDQKVDQATCLASGTPHVLALHSQVDRSVSRVLHASPGPASGDVWSALHLVNRGLTWPRARAVHTARYVRRTSSSARTPAIEP